MSFTKQSYVCRNWFASRSIKFLYHDGIRVFYGVTADFDGTPIDPPVVSRVSLLSQETRRELDRART